MYLQKARQAVGNVTQSISRNPWLYGGMIFFAFVGTAMALNNKQDFMNLLSQEQGLDAISDIDLKSMFKGYTEGMSVESICAELNSYVAMCDLFSPDFVSINGDVTVSDCATGEHWGSSSNPTALVCNFAKIMQRGLPDDILETCVEMAKQTARAMSSNS